jgi:hypothetical protein
MTFLLSHGTTTVFLSCIGRLLSPAPGERETLKILGGTLRKGNA